MLLEQLSQHKLDMIISDCPIDSTQQEGLFSVRIGECGVSFGVQIHHQKNRSRLVWKNGDF